MRVSYHPDFPKEIKRFEAQYREVSEQLALRFRAEVDNAIEHIKSSPGSAGHFLNTGSQVVKEVRSAICPRFHFLFCTVFMKICWYFGPSSPVHRIL
jgi:hypothetical protein